MIRESFGRWDETVINMIMHIIAFIIFLMAVWYHSWKMIIIAIVVVLLGYFIQAIIIEKPNPIKKRE